VLNTYLIYLRFRTAARAFERGRACAGGGAGRKFLQESAARISRILGAWPENLKLPESQEADIVDLAHDGRGVARVDGKAVFIAGALPGERVRFRVFKRRRQWTRRPWSKC
jgi:predicted RNA-binding protein with TRAM domain